MMIRTTTTATVVTAAVAATILGILPLQSCMGQKIAVVGGGISGTFVSKYLIDYDKNHCSIESLTIFDPVSTIGEKLKPSTIDNPTWQGNRVGTLQLDDGRIIEVGASILTEKFEHIIEMAELGNLTVGKPFDTCVPEKNETESKHGMAIYHGGDGNGGTSKVPLNVANMTPFWKKFTMLWRYNVDFLSAYWLVNDIHEKFGTLQTRLRDMNDKFYQSPEEMWSDVGLAELAIKSLDDYCDEKGIIPNYVPWWRRWFLPGQGVFRQELLDAINLVNYNQDNSKINALSGIGSFSAAVVKVLGIQGGNVQLISSAYELAKTNRRTYCPDDNDNDNIISHVSKAVSTVVGSLNGFDLYDSNGTSLGQYDLVILAAPYAMARIDFLVKSHIDEAVLQPMPLGGLVPNVHSEEGGEKIPDEHVGHQQLPHQLPGGVKKPYTQVVTTIVSDAIVQADYLSIDAESIPRGIYMTSAGKASESNITAIAELSAERKLYKIFSSASLDKDVLERLFGSNVKVEYEKTWGGEYGGATPDYNALRDLGGADGVPFLLYDGATGFHGHTKAGALYYPNSLELTFACMELSAMGARAVAKLIAKRMGWLSDTESGYGTGDEL